MRRQPRTIEIYRANFIELYWRDIILYYICIDLNFSTNLVMTINVAGLCFWRNEFRYNMRPTAAVDVSVVFLGPLKVAFYRELTFPIYIYIYTEWYLYYAYIIRVDFVRRILL